MRHEFILVLMLFVSPLVQAEGWEFGDKIPVAPVSSSSVHQHLDATGRNSMAICFGSRLCQISLINSGPVFGGQVIALNNKPSQPSDLQPEMQ